MNWSLILSLSCLGVAMGIATVLGWTGGYELYLWLGIYLFCAVWIARRSGRRRFLHGFMTGSIVVGLASLVQCLLFSTYIAHNPQVAQDFNQIPGGIPPRLFFLILAPVVGAASGVGAGTFAWIAGKGDEGAELTREPEVRTEVVSIATPPGLRRPAPSRGRLLERDDREMRLVMTRKRDDIREGRTAGWVRLAVALNLAGGARAR